MKRLLVIALVACCCATVSCSDDDSPVSIKLDNDKKDDNATNNSGDTGEDYRLDPSLTPYSFDYLKTCIDRTSHPIFKLSGAIEAWDFNSDATLRDTVSAHFDEIVAGNAMKYASCVDGNGNLNFGTVKQFCTAAQAAGVSIFGHTLAWHSQQQPAYLNSLMTKKVQEEQAPGVVETETSLYANDFTKYKGTLGHQISEQEGKVKDGYGHEYTTGDFVDYPFYAMGYVPTMTDEGLESKSSGWYQYFATSRVELDKVDSEADFRLKLSVKSAGNLKFTCIARWSWNEDPATFDVQFNKSSDFVDYAFDFSGIKGNGFDLIFQPSAGTDFVIKNIEVVRVYGKPKSKIVALTDEEKRDTLIWAMDHWIEGMMEATDGYVKAWDVVNEALSGGDTDQDGLYELQNYKNANQDPTSVKSGVFFWQVYMGDLQYVRTAVASARKHFKGNPEELKLFVNDYNLESDWDNNGKLRSLIKWIEKWESDGVTKIDGIGTQMHITCYADAATQKSCEDHIVTMFRLMASTGKLVRISELDMGYKRSSDRWNSPNLATSELTAAEHKKMAEYYKFIIKKYFEIVPPAQQYGICQWCLTDAPGNVGDEGGWRNGEPVGIWTQGYKERKKAYQGWAEALSGK